MHSTIQFFIPVLTEVSLPTVQATHTKSEGINIGFVLYNNDQFFRSWVFQPPLNIKRRVITGHLGKENVLDFVEFTVGNQVWDVSELEKDQIKLIDRTGLVCGCGNVKAFGETFGACYSCPVLPNCTVMCVLQNVSSMRLYDFACVFWDYDKNDWNTKDCIKDRSPVHPMCICKGRPNLANFAMLMVRVW